MTLTQIRPLLKPGMKIKVIASKCCPKAIGQIDEVVRIDKNGGIKTKNNFNCEHYPGAYYLDDEVLEIVEGFEPHENMTSSTLSASFPPDKTAKELNIDTSRKFILLNKCSICSSKIKIGDIFTLKKDDDTPIVYFWKNKDRSDYFAIKWSHLAYLDEYPSIKPKLFINELRAHKEKTFMKKLSELAATIRRTFDKDQKALWQVGYIDDCGKPAERAKAEALDTVVTDYFEQHKADFVANAKEELEIIEAEKE